MPESILVTGGGGFLGGHIVRAIQSRWPTARIGSLTRSAQPELEAIGVTAHRGDIANKEDVLAALKARYEAVIHTAAMVNPWGDPEAFYRANVTGTQVLLDASRQSGVTRFVFTSSPSAVFDGTSMDGVTALEVPYPARFPSPYGETKALSEQLVQQAYEPESEGSDGFLTASLRPQLMWGPGDPHVLPLLIKRARAGSLRRIGSEETMIDVTYVENAAMAHLDALHALDKSPDDPTHPGGKIYFISNDEPVRIWDFIPQALKASGEPGVRSPAVPKSLARQLGRIVSGAWTMLGRADEPPISEYVVLKMCTDQWYDMARAKRDLGYAPMVSMAEGLERWGTWYASHKETI